MVRHKVEIRQPGAAGNPADILVDGEKVRGVRSFRVSSIAGELTTLELGLTVFEGSYFGEPQIVLTPASRETLLRFGWTPPAEEA